MEGEGHGSYFAKWPLRGGDLDDEGGGGVPANLTRFGEREEDRGLLGLARGDLRGERRGLRERPAEEEARSIIAWFDLIEEDLSMTATSLSTAASEKRESANKVGEDSRSCLRT